MKRLVGLMHRIVVNIRKEGFFFKVRLSLFLSVLIQADHVHSLPFRCPDSSFTSSYWMIKDLYPHISLRKTPSRLLTISCASSSSQWSKTLSLPWKRFSPRPVKAKALGALA